MNRNGRSKNNKERYTLYIDKLLSIEVLLDIDIDIDISENIFFNKFYIRTSTHINKFFVTYS